MTTMDFSATLAALRRLRVETGSLVCFGCGHEHNYSTHGCAILRNAVEHMEAALSNYDSLSALVHHLETELKSEILSAAELRARMANEWVSVEERLPDAEKEVRLFCVTPNGYKYQCQGFYVPPGMRRDDSDYSWDWECCDQYDEDSDDYFVNPGWYESSHNWDEYSAFGIADKVTYWMPLPEPPGKEG